MNLKKVSQILHVHKKEGLRGLENLIIEKGYTQENFEMFTGLFDIETSFLHHLAGHENSKSSYELIRYLFSKFPDLNPNILNFSKTTPLSLAIHQRNTHVIMGLATHPNTKIFEIQPNGVRLDLCMTKEMLKATLACRPFSKMQLDAKRLEKNITKLVPTFSVELNEYVSNPKHNRTQFRKEFHLEHQDATQVFCMVRLLFFDLLQIK